MAGRARGQFRTGLVCHRFFPDPPGNAFAVNFSESFLPVAKCAPGRARGGRLWRAGARHSAPPRSASLLPFLPTQERKAPGRGRGAPGLWKMESHFRLRCQTGGVTFLSPNKKVTKEVGLRGAECRAAARQSRPLKNPPAALGEILPFHLFPFYFRCAKNQ